jgi:hypothetical protein
VAAGTLPGVVEHLGVYPGYQRYVD